jgi:hypothetical protein
MSGWKIIAGCFVGLSLVLLFFCAREFLRVVDSVPKEAFVESKNCNRRGPAQIRVISEGKKYTVTTTDGFCHQVEVGSMLALFYDPGLDKFFATKDRNYPALVVCIGLVIAAVWLFRITE